MKKLATLFLAFVMLVSFSISAFAAESVRITDTPTSQGKLSKDYSSYIEKIVEDSQSGRTRAWPGSGPAAPVTQVQIVDCNYFGDDFPGYEDHIGVVVVVIGHGRDYATYDGVRVNSIYREHIILDGGPLVDGWVYYFDCGVPTVGSHNFEIKMTSHNYPYNTKSASTLITVY